MNKKYSIAGLGKLGASMAAGIAKRGFDVIGVDVSQRTIDLVNNGHAPVQETDLEQLIAANSGRIRATSSHREAVLDSDVTFVVVPTPSDERGAFSLEYAAAAFTEIGKALAEKDEYHLVVMTSTVLPGATRFGLIPLLEEHSGKTCGRDFGVCYSPEFIALGSVIRDFLNPDFTLVGEFDSRSGDLLESCYHLIMENGAPCRRMSLENAELTKIAVNTFVTTKITFANMISELCELLPGGDVDVVTEALGSDARIGRKYLKGGTGYGGPCFPRDNVALGFMARALGTSAPLAETTDAVNRSLAEQFVKDLRQLVPSGARVALLGLAYKPYSHVIDESQGVALARALAKDGASVRAYDPLAGASARAVLADVDVVEDIAECLRDADVVIVTTADPEFRALKAPDFVRNGATVTVVDFWRMLSEELSGASGIRYVPMGRSRSDEQNSKRLHDLWSPKQHYAVRS